MGKGSTGASDSVTSGLQSDATALTQIASQQAGQGQQLFNASFPGFQAAEQHAQQLSSGNPYMLAQATAPVAQQADAAAAASKQNILQNGPAGGEKNLALENVDVNRGATVGNAASSSYLNSFNTLAGLSGQGIGMGQGSTSLGISGYGGAGSQLSSLGGLQLQGQQLQAQEKGNSLGALSSLGGDAASIIGGTSSSSGASGLKAL